MDKPYGFYQHYDKLFVSGAKGFPQEPIDALNLSFDNSLHGNKRGSDADAYYRSHHGMGTVIGHSLGAAISLALEKQYKQEGDNPYGIVHPTSFGAPVVSGNLGNRFGEFGKSVVNGGILASGVPIGTCSDASIGFADAGLLSK